MIMDKLIKKAYNVSLKTASKAGKYLMKKYLNGNIEVKASSKHDVKLDVDIEVENLIKRTIKRYFPDHGFICEEGGREKTETKFNWVIDPLDGTVNFSRGIPHFCSSIAFKEGKSCLIGVVIDPVRNEIFSAIDGVGAFLNGVPIKNRSINSLQESIVAGGFFKSGSIQKGITNFNRLVKKVKKVRFFGAAALDLCYLACGRVNGYIQYSVDEWDIAAASLIARLAGVKLEIQEKKGKFYIIAADKEIFNAFRAEVMFEKT